MLRTAKAAFGTLVLIILLPLDLGLKALLGITAALVLWLPFYFLTDFGLRPGLFLGLGFSILLWGIWDGSDMFHLNSMAEWAH